MIVAFASPLERSIPQVKLSAPDGVPGAKQLERTAGGHPQLIAQTGHSTGINVVAYSPNGRTALTGSDDGTALLWDIATGRELRRFAHGSVVISVAFAVDGKMVLTGTSNGSARQWDAATGRQYGSIEARDPRVTSMAFAPDGKTVFMGSGDGSARLWDLATGRQLQRLGVRTQAGVRVAFAPDGKTVLAAGTANGSAQLWDIAAQREVRRLEGYVSDVSSVAFAPDGKTVLTGSSDASARLWDVATGREKLGLKGHALEITSAAFAPNCKTVLTGSLDGSARLWDLATGRQLQRLGVHTQGGVYVAFAPDGKTVLTAGTADGSAQLWDIAAERELRRLEGYVLEVSSVAFAPDGKTVLTGSSDGSARLWDAATRRQYRRFDTHSRGSTSVAYAPDGKTVLTGSSDGIPRLWEAATGKRIQAFGRGGASILSVAYAPDGRKVFTGSSDGISRLWEAATGEEIRPFGRRGVGVLSVAYAPDGRTAVTGSRDGIVRVWDVMTGGEIKQLSGHRGSVYAVAFSTDGRTILTAAYDGTARQWDAATGCECRSLEVGPPAKNRSLVFAPDGKTVLTGLADGSVQVWDFTTRGVIQTLRGHSQWVRSVALAPDGRSALTGSFDGTGRLWDLKSGRELCRLIGFLNGSAAVVDLEGRFDVNWHESTRGLSWVFLDDPFRPLPLEIYSRDFFEPRLLPRIVEGEKLRPVRLLAGLDRAQPQVQVTQVHAGSKPGTVDVTVEVDPVAGKITRRGTAIPTRSVHDLRLFRDRQLVDQEPAPAAGKLPPDGVTDDELEAWAAATLVGSGGRVTVDARTGHQTAKFEGVRLPSVPGQKVEFTAYAFNADRVKSADGSASHEVPRNVIPAQPHAYMVAFGVAGFTDPVWDLHYCAADARLAASKLVSALKGAGHYKVVPVVLTSERGAAGGAPRLGEAPATAANLKLVLDALAGRQVDARALAAVPNAERLAAATPDDVVILFASTHGFTDPRGAYYIFPQDIGKPRGLGRVVTPDLLEACVSSGELSAWLRQVDAGQFALIVDCCHAAATVEQPGFKPGPMGSRGLGQLAYDKGMRVLAASQADDVALEALVKGEGHGLLTYALVREGLMGKRTVNGGVARTLGSLLTYAEGRVPGLYSEVLKAAEGSKGITSDGTAVLVERGGELVPLGGDVAPAESTLRKKKSFQTPTLFDYARERDVHLGNKK
jgi:WD40 repeat protein